MITVKEVVDFLEGIAPGQLQESYDNSGLITGSDSLELTSILISLDCTEEVVEEAPAEEAAEEIETSAEDAPAEDQTDEDDEESAGA